MKRLTGAVLCLVAVPGVAGADTPILPFDQVRADASDEGANPPGEGARQTADAPLFVLVDRTAPELTATRRGDGAVEVIAKDLVSPIRRVEVTAGDRIVFSPRAEDGACDSLQESFRIEAGPLSTDVSLQIRAADAAGNTTTQPVPSR